MHMIFYTIFNTEKGISTDFGRDKFLNITVTSFDYFLNDSETFLFDEYVKIRIFFFFEIKMILKLKSYYKN